MITCVCAFIDGAPSQTIEPMMQFNPTLCIKNKITRSIVFLCVVFAALW